MPRPMDSKHRRTLLLERLKINKKQFGEAVKERKALRELTVVKGRDFSMELVEKGIKFECSFGHNIVVEEDYLKSFLEELIDAAGNDDYTKEIWIGKNRKATLYTIGDTTYLLYRMQDITILNSEGEVDAICTILEDNWYRYEELFNE